MKYGRFLISKTSTGLLTAFVTDDNGLPVRPANVVPASMVGMTEIGDHIVPLESNSSGLLFNLIDEVEDGRLVVVEEDDEPTPTPPALVLAAA